MGLVVERLRAGYGAMEVVSGVSLEVAPGELVAVLGRNGAGKTTSLLAIAGVRGMPPSGSIMVGGVDISEASPAEAVRAGLAVVPEGHRIFGAMTVRENLRIGAYPWRRRKGGQLEEDLARVFALFPILAEFAEREAGLLSGGQQQMVAMGQALMADPQVLLLDEPSSGLAPAVVDSIYEAVLALRGQGRALLVVEQNVDRALRVADRAYVMDRGQVVMSGAVTDLRLDNRVADIVRGVAILEGN